MLDIDREFDDEKKLSKASLINVICLNKTLRIVVGLVTISIIIPGLLYFTMFHQTPSSEKFVRSCTVPSKYRVPCGEKNISFETCQKLGCCMKANSSCFHSLPSAYQYIENSVKNHYSPTKELSPITTSSYRNISMKIKVISEEKFEISVMKIDGKLKDTKETEDKNNITLSLLYTYKIYKPFMILEVSRKSSKKAVISTARGPLIMSQNYFEWTLDVNCSKIYGIDRLELTEGTYLLLNNGTEAVVPYIICHDKSDDSYFGLYFPEINAPTEIQVLKSNILVIRSMVSNNFRIEVLMGPKVNDIYNQLKGKDENQHFEFGDLGIHLCNPSKYLSVEQSVANFNALVKNENNMFDSYCINSNLGHKKNLTDLVKTLKENGKRVLINLNPFEGYSILDGAVREELLLKDQTYSTLIGLDDMNKKIAYFDFIMKTAGVENLLTQEAKKFEELKPDGYLVTPTVPFDNSNKSTDLKYDSKFLPEDFLSSVEHLIPMDALLSNNESFVQNINLYSAKQLEVFHQLFPSKTLISDIYSKYTKTGILIKSNEVSWTQFRRIVQKSIFYSTVGIQYFGSVVCGDNMRAIPEDLCVRWYQFSTFVPMFYLESNKIASKFTGSAARIINDALKLRYSLLNHMYSLMLSGDPILTPMFFHYDSLEISDSDSLSQFMFGDSILISPVVYQKVNEVRIYFPEKYYELNGGLEMPGKKFVQFSVVLNDIPIFIRAGHTIALTEVSNEVSINSIRLQPFYLIVAFSCTERGFCVSSGKLQLTKELNINFLINEKQLNITVQYEQENTLDLICGPNPIISNLVSYAKIYGFSGFNNKYDHETLKLNINFCKYELKNSIIFQL